MSNPRDGEMTFRLPPGAVIADPAAARAPVELPRPAFNILVAAQDGTELVTMTERDGRLVVGGDESRWDEGAKRFLHGLMQWSGQVGIAWKDEVKKAAQEGGW